MNPDDLYELDVRANDCSDDPYAMGSSELVIQWTSTAERWTGDAEEYARARSWALSAVSRLALAILQAQGTYNRVAVSQRGLGVVHSDEDRPDGWSDVVVYLSVRHAALSDLERSARRYLQELADSDAATEDEILSEQGRADLASLEADGIAPAPRAHLAVVQHDGDGAA